MHMPPQSCHSATGSTAAVTEPESVEDRLKLKREQHAAAMRAFRARQKLLNPPQLEKNPACWSYNLKKQYAEQEMKKEESITTKKATITKYHQWVKRWIWAGTGLNCYEDLETDLGSAGNEAFSALKGCYSKKDFNSGNVYQFKVKVKRLKVRINEKKGSPAAQDVPRAAEEIFGLNFAFLGVQLSDSGKLLQPAQAQLSDSAKGVESPQAQGFSDSAKGKQPRRSQ
eukprot:3114384-Rhodomonas_salina.1